MSLRFPAVNVMAKGTPCPSQITWCFEPGRRRSTGEGPVFSPPLCPHVRAVNNRPGPVELASVLQLIQQRERHPAVARRERSTPTPEHRRASPGSLALPTPHRIVSELSEASYITHHRTGRRSTYVVHPTYRCPTQSHAIRTSANCCRSSSAPPDARPRCRSRRRRSALVPTHHRDPERDTLVEVTVDRYLYLVHGLLFKADVRYVERKQGC